MGKAKRLRKARMARRQCDPVYINPSASRVGLEQFVRIAMAQGVRHRWLRFGPGTIRGRNPKVLAKRRRQRERLATLRAVREVAMDVWKCSDGTFALLSEDAEREAMELQRTYAEQLHAIAEGR